MSDALQATFQNIDAMLESCTIDYNALKSSHLDKTFFENYDQTRIVNSFLFNFGKLQDKIGAKLFKQVLYELKEIDTFSYTVIDVLNMLEKLHILDNIDQWEKLRELRNVLAHEYPFEIEERVENIGLALEGFEALNAIYLKLKESVRIPN